MDIVEEIKSRLSIVDVVSDYVQLRPAGKNLKGVCPFHQDTRPSLVVSEDKGLAWCFACQSGGDIFSFVQQIENISFQEAVKLLAEKAHIEIKQDAFTSKNKEKKDRLIDLMEIATEKFENNFKINRNAIDEVKKREISDQTIGKFRLGFAFKMGHEMEKYLLEKGFSHKEMLEAGLIIPEGNRDKFVNRIVFPIFSRTGTPVGFSGRALGDGQPKYLNSPDTILFKKSELLYGLNFAKEEIRKKDHCIVVEGQFDVLSCYDKGFLNTVACSGTAFTDNHVKQIMRFSKNIVFALDGDAAGISATKRALERTISNGANVYVALMNKDEDPDDLLRRNPAEFANIIENKKSVIEFLIDDAIGSLDIKKSDNKRKIIENLKPFVELFPGHLEKDEFCNLIAEKIFTSAQIIKSELNSKTQKPINQENPKSTYKDTHTQEQYLLGVILAEPEFYEIVKKRLIESILSNFPEKSIFKQIKDVYNEVGYFGLKSLKGFLSDDEAKKLTLLNIYAEERLDKIPEILRNKELEKIIKNINEANIIRTQKELTYDLKSASPQEQKNILLKIKQLTDLRKNL
ncbi:MAG: DNA primase [Candidatus Gracilibacteria bacterium]|jgi:DNA primase|nr:DNA primase [Candidatus Gracilibacteria bacterium]